MLGTWGYAGTSMEDVAGAVGVTKKTLYHYFPSKDDLVFALSTRMLAEHAAAMTEVHASGQGASERLLALIRYFAARAPAPEVMRDVSRFLPEPRQAELTRAFLEAVVAPIEAVVREGMESGEFSKHQDPHLAAWLVLGALSALPALGAVHREVLDPERVLALLTFGLAGTSLPSRQPQ